VAGSKVSTEAVPLGNVMRVPGSAAGLTLGEHGARHFNEYQDAAESDGADCG
jgi:hypothetical protein